jgi:hypothetical protein
MQNIKINKIAAIGLVMVLVVGFGQGTKPPPASVLQKYVEQEFYISGNYPKAGDVFEIVYRVKLKPEVEPKSGDYCLRIFCGPSGSIEIVGKDRFFFSGLGAGEWKEFHTPCRILRPVDWIHFDVGIYKIFSGKFYGPLATTQMFLYLIDPQTGQYGTREEYEGRLPVEYRYDPLVGTFTCSPSQNPAPVEENREIIKTIKKLAPTLSDSLALVLHSEQYRVGVPKGLPRWDSLNQRWREEEIFEYYLKDGWLDALNRNELGKWEEKERIKIQAEHREKKSQFFRGKNHYYNKDQGLLGDAKRDTVKQCRARCLIRYTEGSNTYYSYFNQKCITDDSGYFFITVNVNPSWTACRVYPVLFPAGPDLNNPVINVSDPNITIPDFWKDPDEPATEQDH